MRRRGQSSAFGVLALAAIPALCSGFSLARFCRQTTLGHGSAAVRSPISVGGLSHNAKQARSASLEASGPMGLRMGAEYDKLSAVKVISVSSGKEVPLTSTWPKSGGKKSLVVMLTHWGDLTSWEYAQKLRFYLPTLKAKGVSVVLVGIGGLAAGAEFAESNGIPKEILFSDPNADAAASLELSPGFARKSVQEPQANGVSPYLRLLPMLLGIGSPGTLPKVLYGYFGDRNSNPEWIPAQLDRTQTGSFPYVEAKTFDRLGSGYLRPFELATVRLQNMISVLNRWDALIPDNKDLVVQQGGTLVFQGEETAYFYKDKGILVYAPLDEVLAAATN